MKTKTMKRFRHTRLEIEDLFECMRESDGITESVRREVLKCLEEAAHSMKQAWKFAESGILIREYVNVPGYEEWNEETQYMHVEKLITLLVDEYILTNRVWLDKNDIIIFLKIYINENLEYEKWQVCFNNDEIHITKIR